MTFHRVSVWLIATAFVFVTVQPAGTQAPPTSTRASSKVSSRMHPGKPLPELL